MRELCVGAFVLVMAANACAAESDLITNVDNRQTTSLNGEWKIIIDPYEAGYYDYLLKPAPWGYFKNAKPADKTERIEYSFDDSDSLNVPGDWNSQRKELFWYEGTIWYKKSFDYDKKPHRRVFVYFGAANYQANVYLNGELLGRHTGGFTPFNFEITDRLREKGNFVVVKVDNRRLREGVPTVSTDWFNYGGLTRRVLLVDVPETFIKDYFIQLEKGSLDRIAGWIQLNGPAKEQAITIEIPEANVRHTCRTNAEGYAEFAFEAKPALWSPEAPKLCEVVVKSQTDAVTDRIGFRSIEAKGTDILLNGKPVFLRGICLHEEAPFADGARAHSKEHAEILLRWARELGCNFVRLAHYPHNELMIRTADEMGLMVWSEIPVYWTILWGNQKTFENAKNQLTEMITRDKNRACIILWSMANEAPRGDRRLEFLRKLTAHARSLDSTRLITAAMDLRYADAETIVIDDRFAEYVDVLGCNEYVGWYDGLPEKADQLTWRSAYNKPVIISEFGGGALYGLHGDELTRWSEEFQQDLYKRNLAMLEKVDFIKGISPWILKDFRSPRRHLPRIQDFWNRKGLVTDKGEKKKAYFVLQSFYVKKKRSQ